MNIAILTAGGTGSRMNQAIPKQFMLINDKPLLVYTIERFQNCSNIDRIAITCLSGWEEKVWEYVKTYNLNKVKYVVTGGSTGQESIYNGFNKIQCDCNDNDIILIHDGNRPMVSSEIINRGIETCKKYGNAVAYIPCQEVMFLTDDMKKSNKQIERSKLARTQTPHLYYVKNMKDIYEQAEKRGIKDCVAMCSMCEMLGIETNLYLGSERNIKTTTPDDVDIFKALLAVEKNEEKN